MGQINFATSIPPIYDTTTIIGACGVASNVYSPDRTLNDDWYRHDALLDCQRAKGLGSRQVWYSATPGDEGFIHSHPQMIITNVLKSISQAAEMQKTDLRPSQILVILYGLGNPSVGCYMDYTKLYTDRRAILTPTMIASAFSRHREVTLVMRTYVPMPWVNCLGNLRDILQEKELGGDKFAAYTNNGQLVRQRFREPSDIQSYRAGSTNLQHYSTEFDLAAMLTICPRDSNGKVLINLIGDLGNEIYSKLGKEEELVSLTRGCTFASLIHFRMALAIFTDNLAAKFNLIRPFGQTCLDWQMAEWFVHRAPLTGYEDSYNEAFNEARDVEVRYTSSGLCRCSMYIRAAFFETFGHSRNKDEVTKENSARFYHQLTMYFNRGRREVFDFFVSLTREISASTVASNNQDRRTRLEQMTHDKFLVVDPETLLWSQTRPPHF
ncbi:ORF20 protein [Fusarium austroafricanum]|uniref:ORF20 protein n=1 Tax=Fusarium austroafricanum TaxID=2364996 RepID=A0A8H4KEH5_9HYPO|nr:ORF20 protein [Fusarium austroafricanum]